MTMSTYREHLVNHKHRTDRVSSQVQSFYKRGEPFRIYHGGTNSTRRRKHNPAAVVDTSDFSNVLAVDRERRVAIVEPNVSMEKLVDAVLPLGLVPLVVMEFPAITVGGGFSGSSGESSSFRHGFFENTIINIEIVLGNGDVVQASPNENADLYHGASGSFGTLGVVTMLEVQLVEAKPYIELQYWPVSSARDAVSATEKHTDDQAVQYLDGILFSKDRGLIMTGRMAELDKTNSHLRRQSYRGPWDPWFFTRAEKILKSTQSGYRELVPIKDYFFRYDRGAFWAGLYSFEYFLTPFNRFTRWALDDLLHTNVMYKALHKSGLANQYIVQDIGFPYENVPEFVEYLDQGFGHYPLWLCPLYIKEHVSLSPLLPPYQRGGGGDLRLLNIGVWGPGPTDHARFVKANREIEQKTKELGGLKCLYAHAYYTEDEFYSIYDKNGYDKLRQKYSASLIPSVFEKVTTNDSYTTAGSKPSTLRETAFNFLKNVWPVRGIYGAFYVLNEPDLNVSRVHIVLLLPLFVLLVAWAILTRTLSRLLHLVSGRSDTGRVSPRA